MSITSLPFSRFYRSQVQIPVTTRYELIFPFNFRSFSFPSHFYGPEMTGNRIQASQIRAFLDEIDDTCDGFSNINTWSDSFYVSIYAILMVFIVLIDIFEEKHVEIASALFFLGALCIVITIIRNIMITKEAIKNYRLKILGVLEYSNQNLYEIMGLKWEISPIGIEWLELKVNYRIDEEPSEALFRDNEYARREYYGGKTQASYPVFINNDIDCIKHQLPPSTDTCLIFPFDYKKFRYQTSFYRDELTEGRLEKSTVENFVESLSQSFIRAKISRMANVLSFLQTLIILSGVIIIMQYNLYNIYHTHRLLVEVLCIMFAHVIQIIKYSKRYKLLFQERARAFDIIAKNNREMERLGLRWAISPCDIDWLELWFDYKFSELNEHLNLVEDSQENGEDKTKDTSSLL